ncbi:hypothetical protein CEXT_699971, partial [Caerostris extrusa]
NLLFQILFAKTLAPTKSVSGPDTLTSSALPGDQDPDVSRALELWVGTRLDDAASYEAGPTVRSVRLWQWLQAESSGEWAGLSGSLPDLSSHLTPAHYSGENAGKEKKRKGGGGGMLFQDIEWMIISGLDGEEKKKRLRSSTPLCECCG